MCRVAGHVREARKPARGSGDVGTQAGAAKRSNWVTRRRGKRSMQEMGRNGRESGRDDETGWGRAVMLVSVEGKQSVRGLSSS